MKTVIAVYPRRSLVLPGLLLIIDGVFFSTVDPSGSHVSVVIAGCALAVISIYAVWTMIVALFSRLHPLPRSARRSLRWAGSAVCSYLLLMQSIGQLDLRDAIAAILLAAILYLYTAYPSWRAP